MARRCRSPRYGVGSGQAEQALQVPAFHRNACVVAPTDKHIAHHHEGHRAVLGLLHSGIVARPIGGDVHILCGGSNRLQEGLEAPAEWALLLCEHN